MLESFKENDGFRADPFLHALAITSAVRSRL
jgi:hypothetical protein